MDDDAVRTAKLIGELEALAAPPTCPGCGTATCFHEVVISHAMGFKDAPRCLACLATGLDQARDRFRDQVYAHISRRECFTQGWLWASHREGFDDQMQPPCLFHTDPP